MRYSPPEGEECLKEFIEKRLTSPEKGFSQPIKRSDIQITIEKKRDIIQKNRKTREISIFKEDWQNLGVFIANHPFKK